MDEKSILRKSTKETKSKPLTVNLFPSYKEKYDILAENIEMSEQVRRVICAEIDRVWDKEMAAQQSEEAS